LYKSDSQRPVNDDGTVPEGYNATWMDKQVPAAPVRRTALLPLDRRRRTALDGSRSVTDQRACSRAAEHEIAAEYYDKTTDILQR